MDNDKAKKIKKDFPILEKNIVYLDNASTTQKPKDVINRIKDFYENENANINRGIYDLSVNATVSYEDSRKKVSEFINSEVDEVIFTSGATDSLNFLAYVIKDLIPNGKDEILLTELEHHSNIVPWQQFAKKYNFKVKYVKIKDNYTLDLDDLQKKLNKKTAIFSFTHVSNTLGTVNPINEITQMAIKEDVITIIDAAQSIGHKKIDVKEIGCDFLYFSGHKMCAPTGVGVLYINKKFLEKIEPFRFGGDMIEYVKKDKSKWKEIPERFEAGTPNVCGVIALESAIEYLEKIGLQEIESWEKELANNLIEELEKNDKINLFVPPKDQRSGIVSFTVESIHTHDIVSLLNDSKICVRGGKHCTMPLMDSIGINGTIRVSFYLYNTMEDVIFFVQKLNNIISKFK